jgi:ribulose-phosphate 3-epimerase
MNIVSPSILSCDFLNIEKELTLFNNMPNTWIHLDIMDGHFVPNLTFGIPIVKKISQFIKIPGDAHLMVSNPAFHIEEMKDFGLHNITFHLEAANNSLEIIEHAKKFYPSVGISIKPNTSVEEISLDIFKKIDLILVMSVEPGFGGQSFIQDSYQKISQLSEIRKNNQLSFQIQIDGGVSDINSKTLREHGADNLVAGSYIFKQSSDSYQQFVDNLR